MKRLKVKVHLHVHVQREKSVSVSPKPSSRKASFFRFIEQEIERASADGQRSTSRNYRTALNSLRRFCQKKDLRFQDFTPRMAAAYELWLKQEGICLNTASCYMRSLRAVYNKAVEQGLTSDGQPFRHVYTGVEHTAKRSLATDSLHCLQQLLLKEGSPHAVARDLFLFSLQACGMPFVDMAYLTRAQINDGYLSYHRHKTGRLVTIRLEERMMQIIKRYESISFSPYVFPIIRSADPDTAYRHYRTGIGYYNRLLRQLAHRCGFTEKLTSYASRHSWASLAYESNVMLPVISKALGHATTQTTLIYIRELKDDALEQANRQIMDLVFPKRDI